MIRRQLTEREIQISSEAIVVKVAIVSYCKYFRTAPQALSFKPHLVQVKDMMVMMMMMMMLVLQVQSFWGRGP